MKRSSNWMSVLPSLVIPLVIGAICYMGLSAAVKNEVITNEATLRYLTGHPISKITTGMFFIGAASLLLIGMNLFDQFRWIDRIRLPFIDTPGTNDSPEPNDSENLTADTDTQDPRITALEALPEKTSTHYLWKRLYSAVEYINRTGSATNVEEELKYLADSDHYSQTQRYSLVRIMIWAMPMLGFLGTVLGISQALGGLNMGPDKDFGAVMGNLQASLYVAFDTTALALGLSIILMFCTFLVERFESQLLEQVEHEARRKIAEQFDFTGKPDSAVQTMERIGREVLLATERTVQRQAEIWRNSFDQAEDAWLVSSSQTHEKIRLNLGVAIDEAIENMAHLLSQSIGKADESLATRWEQWQITMSDNARQITTQQDALQKHTELLESMLTKIENLSQIQENIDNNLDTTTTAYRLDQSLNSLNTCLIELNRKLGKEILKSTLAPSSPDSLDAKSKSAVDAEPFQLRLAQGTQKRAA